jgi:predicted metal-dependent phosphotriesterase family hydrolase
MPVNRRKFIGQSACITAGYFIFIKSHVPTDNKIMTVNGWIDADKMGFSLTHEHILVDFIGANKANPLRYDAEEVFKKALPKLLSVKEKGCRTIMECTPEYIGRDVKLLKKLAEASGLNILTNTGYYGAAKEKYLPDHTYTETAEQLAIRWISEWKNGIDGSGIKPGFIKSGVDNFPLSVVQQKITEAAAITHLATGLTIGIHTGNGRAAMEELDIIQSKGVAAEAWIWIHAQNENERSFHIRAAKSGGWVSFDNISGDSISACFSFLKDMKEQQLLHKVLLSHDSGWYHVGEPNGGNYNDYNAIADKLIPAMKENGFTEKDIRLLFIQNPANAFAVSVRKK